MESYGPVKGRCRKGYKKNKTTKMCDPIKEDSKTLDSYQNQVKNNIKSKKLKSYGPVKDVAVKDIRKTKQPRCVLIERLNQN